MTNHTISTPFFQTKTQTDTIEVHLSCLVCGLEICKNEAAAGPYNANGDLTFICNLHLRNSHQFIGQLADFIASERQRNLNTGAFPSILKDAPDAWFLY